MEKIIGYCMRCKAKREMKNTKLSATKKKTLMIKGICSKCGTKMCKITGGKK